MGSLIDSITKLFNLTKLTGVTASGLVSAVALAVLMYPPQPSDTIFKPINVEAVTESVARRPSPVKAQGATNVKPATEDPTDVYCDWQPQPLQPPYKDRAGVRGAAIDNQTMLDKASRDANLCLTAENTLLLGADDDINAAEAQLKQDLATRDAAKAAVAAYGLKLSDARGILDANARTADTQVANDLKLADQAHGRKNIRAAHFAQGQIFQKEIQARLADPGRLRPRQSFDDYLTGLTNHAIAFLLFAIVVGIGVQPLSMSLGGFMYWALGLRNVMNWLWYGNQNVQSLG